MFHSLAVLGGDYANLLPNELPIVTGGGAVFWFFVFANYRKGENRYVE